MKHAPQLPESTQADEPMPSAVRQALYGMGASLLLGLALNGYQLLTVENSASVWDVLLAIGFALITVLVYWQIARRHNGARVAYLLLTVASYGLGALDPMGMSRLDLLGVVLTAPIDIFVVLRLFGASATRWFLRSA